MGPKTKAQAMKKAKALKKRMKGKGWKTRVWENLGWHYEVHNKGLTVHVDWDDDDGDSYSTLLSSDGIPGGGETYWTENKSFSDPNKAVERQLKTAQKHMKNIVDSFEILLQNIKG